jgi:ABC-type amino acid transport substrate-binding protein
MKKVIQTLIVLTVLTLLLAACGGGGEPAATSAPEVTEPTAETVEEAEPAAGEADDLLAEIEARGTIRVSTDPNYEPQSFLDENGEFVGFDIDVAREIAERLGVEVEFVTPDWDIITAGNWGGQCGHERWLDDDHNRSPGSAGLCRSTLLLHTGPICRRRRVWY